MKTTQRSVTDQKPNAWIVNPTDRGRKSIKKDNKIYLKDGQNFEIELFNPLKESVLAEIKVNGKSVSSTGLILRPGERFYLDCFIDDKKKFVFKTYEVENTEASKEAISINGVVEVFFYKEETLSINNWKDKFRTIETHHYHYNYPWYPYYPWLQTVTIPSMFYVTGSSGITTGTTTLFGTTNNSGSGQLHHLTTGVNTSTISGSTSALFGSITNTSNCYGKINSVPNQNIETGRIEKGESSSQQFEEINMEFERLHISNVIYQLLPESQKPIETKDIKPLQNSDVIDLIKKLADLHNSGILTDNEFNSKKQELLSKI